MICTRMGYRVRVLERLPLGKIKVKLTFDNSIRVIDIDDLRINASVKQAEKDLQSIRQYGLQGVEND